MQDNKSPASFFGFLPASKAEALANGDRRRFAYYFASLLIGIGLFALPLKDLMAMSVKSELYDYIPLMFALCAFLLVRERKEIFVSPGWSLGYGVPVLILSLAAAGLKYMDVLRPENYLCIMSFSFWLFLVGTFVLFFGPRTFRKAIFPLGMLLFTVPLPAVVLSKVVELLQRGSYLSASWIFHVLGFVPLEHGFVFVFPSISIKVAKECSGIHATVALLILALLCARYFLRSNVNRVLLVLVAVPIATFKNGVRIAALTLAAIYIDPNILSTLAPGRGHHNFQPGCSLARPHSSRHEVAGEKKGKRVAGGCRCNRGRVENAKLKLEGSRVEASMRSCLRFSVTDRACGMSREFMKKYLFRPSRRPEMVEGDH